MAKIFLDTNIIVDIITKRSEIDLESFNKHELYISALSIHIVAYVNKVKIPSDVIDSMLESFIIVDMTEDLCNLSSQGPTRDLEDNIQLHSCVQDNCDYFLTNDKKLLKMIYFGKTKIVKELPNPQ